jgi:hypothetical protein
VVVLENSGAAQPFRIGLWSPWTSTGQFIVFGPPPQNLITAQTITMGTRGPTLIGGDVRASAGLGRYELGQANNLAVVLNESDGIITTTVRGADGAKVGASVSSSLFAHVQVSLTASALPGAGTSHVMLRNFRLTLPHQWFWASKADDPLLTAILLLLAVAGALLLAIATVTRFRYSDLAMAANDLRLRLSLNRRSPVLLAVVGAIAFYVIGNALLFPLGGHPFDMGDEKLYAYVARTYGSAQLYYLPNVVSLAWIWNGTPLVEAAFPYEPVSAYLHTAIGWVNSIVFAGGGIFSPRSLSVEYLTKAVNVAFGLADAILVLQISRHLGLNQRRSFVASALFLFNPAVWFSMSIWGQTHVFSIFLVLAAVVMAEKHRITGAWLALAAACLTRPQMLVFGLLLGVAFLRKFTWQENVQALSWSVVGTFLLLMPLMLATSASLPVDIMLHNLHVQEGGGNAATLTTVSQDSYSIWPLVTYAVRGASSLQRSFTPSSEYIVGSVTYQQLGLGLTVLALLLVTVALVVRTRGALDSGRYLPLVALGICSFLMFVTGVVATHFLLALPFLLLCRRWIGSVAYVYIVAIWTITTLVPMFGDMGIAISASDYPLLAPSQNDLTRFAVALYSSDRFITVSIVANVCALAWLALLTLRPTPDTARPGDPGLLSDDLRMARR